MTGFVYLGWVENGAENYLQMETNTIWVAFQHFCAENSKSSLLFVFFRRHAQNAVRFRDKPIPNDIFFFWRYSAI
jgi:hypothetical protein